MIKYKLIAREIINKGNGTFHDDTGLKALDGYAETIFEIPDGESICPEVQSHEIDRINNLYPNHLFEKYEFIRISGNEG